MARQRVLLMPAGTHTPQTLLTRPDILGAVRAVRASLGAGGGGVAGAGRGAGGGVDGRVEAGGVELLCCAVHSGKELGRALQAHERSVRQVGGCGRGGGVEGRRWVRCRDIA